MIRVVCSFLKEGPRAVAPQEGDEAAKELLCPMSKKCDIEVALAKIIKDLT
jgi:hypothetical protein